MKNTARLYTNPGGRTGVDRNDDVSPYEATSESHPGSVKKQKQLRKAKESLMSRQLELRTLVSKLEDRDTQQQAFTSLLELLPQLDGALVADMCTRVEKNKNPRRSSTRRMIVLVLAAMAKCHPNISARLLPRMLAYAAIRLRDKEVQITDACAILCSSIALFVVPYACINGKGHLCPRKKCNLKASDHATDALKDTSTELDDFNFHTFENLITQLSRETNAVGEHATRCIASIIHPTEFDGSTRPPSEVIGAHGQRLTPFLRVFMHSLISRMNESTQYASFSSTFLLLQAIVALSKTLKVDCANRDVYDIVLSHLSSLVDAIEEVFRDAPREDWVVRKRGIELLTQLIELFVCGETSEENIGKRYFDENLERIRRLVTECRHDPVSAVRDAALPAVFLFDKLVKLFPREGSVPAPPSPFKRVFSARGTSGGSAMKGFYSDKTGYDRPQRKKKSVENMNTMSPEIPEENGDQTTQFNDSQGDESATSHDDAPVDSVENERAIVPPLRMAPASVITNRSTQEPTGLHQRQMEMVRTRATRRNIKIPSILVPKSPVQRESVSFKHVNEDEDAFPEENGDEQIADTVVDNGDLTETSPPEAESPRKEAPENEKDAHQVLERPADLPSMTRAEAAIVAAAEGETELALRLSFLEDDMTLLRRVLTIAHDINTGSLSRASRSALCAAFLEFLEYDEEDTDDMWLALVWLKDLSRQAHFAQQLDPRVLGALEIRVSRIAEEPSRAGLVAADILSSMGL